MDGEGDVAGLGEFVGEGHGEAAGVGGGDELFGVGAGAFFEARLEAVGGVVQGVALGGDGALAGFEVAVPEGGCFAVHVILLSLSYEMTVVGRRCVANKSLRAGRGRG